jgi:hypothetical protein
MRRFVARLFATVPRSHPKPKPTSGTAPLTEIVLWQCNKQMQARLMIIVAGVQSLLAIAYFDSLWLVKKREAEAEMVKELRDGLPDAELRSPFHYFSKLDMGLSLAVFAAPFLLLLASRYSTGRWVHEIKLIANGKVAIQTYNVLSQRVTRVFNQTSVVRSIKVRRILICQVCFVLITFLLEPGSFVD